MAANDRVKADDDTAQINITATQAAIENGIRDLTIRHNVSEEQFLDILESTLVPVKKFFAAYQCAIKDVETRFQILDEQLSVVYDGNPIESIQTRLKDYDSILRKIIRKNIPRTLEGIEGNINDIAGVRVVCSFEQDIYLLADYLLQQKDITLIEKKDFIKNPKPSGYRSLHLIVSVPVPLYGHVKNIKVEVQLRTIAMDFWASLEHKLRYKKNLAKETAALLSEELQACAKTSAELDKKMQEIKNKIDG